MIKLISPIIIYNIILYLPNYVIYTIKSNQQIIYFQVFILYIISSIFGSIAGYYFNKTNFRFHLKNSFKSKILNTIDPFINRLFILLFLIQILLLRYNYSEIYYNAYYMMGGYGIFSTLFNIFFIILILPRFPKYTPSRCLLILILYLIVLFFILNRLTNSLITSLIIGAYLYRRFNICIKFNNKFYLFIILASIFIYLLFNNLIESKIGSFFNQMNIVNVTGISGLYDYKLIFYKLFMPLSFFNEIFINKNIYTIILSEIINYAGNNPGFSIDPILELYLACDSSLVNFFVINFIFLFVLNYITCNLLNNKFFIYWFLLIYGGMVIIDFFYIYAFIILHDE